MTAQLYPSGQQLLAGANARASAIKYLILFQNNAALVKGFDPAIITECTFSGYARIDLTGLFGTAAIDANGNGTCSAPQQTFTKMGATPNAQVWGMGYTDTTGAIITWAQLFVDGPYQMVADGDLIRINPLISVSGPIFP